MPRLGQTADRPCPARDGTLEPVWRGVEGEINVRGAGDESPWDVSRPPEAFLYFGVMAFLVLAVGMAVAGSSGQGCLG